MMELGGRIDIRLCRFADLVNKPCPDYSIATSPEWLSAKPKLRRSLAFACQLENILVDGMIGMFNLRATGSRIGWRLKRRETV